MTLGVVKEHRYAAHRGAGQKKKALKAARAMSSFGSFFRVSTFGESHCAGVGCIVDGVPPRMRLTEADIQVFYQCFIRWRNEVSSSNRPLFVMSLLLLWSQVQLDRRRPGQAGAGSISTGRNEEDAVTILSGFESTFFSHTDGIAAHFLRCIPSSDTSIHSKLC